MSEPIFSIRTPGPLTDRLGNSLAKAFSSAPDYRFILDDHEDRVPALTWFFGFFFARLALRYGYIHATEGGDAGIFVFSPGQSPSLWALFRAGVFSLPKHFGYKGTWRTLELGLHLERRRMALAPTSHWYVVAVGVSPHEQGRGLGLELLKRTIVQGDADGLPCYLEVFEEELATCCERFGFHVLHKDILSNGLTLWCMMRPARTAGLKLHHIRSTNSW